MDRPAEFGVGAGAKAGGTVYKGTAEFSAILGVLNTVMAHFEACAADRNAVRAEEEIVLIKAALDVNINEGREVPHIFAFLSTPF